MENNVVFLKLRFNYVIFHEVLTRFSQWNQQFCLVLVMIPQDYRVLSSACLRDPGPERANPVKNPVEKCSFVGFENLVKKT